MALAGAGQGFAQLGDLQEALEMLSGHTASEARVGWAAGIVLTSFDESRMRRVAFKSRPLDYNI